MRVIVEAMHETWLQIGTRCIHIYRLLSEHRSKMESGRSVFILGLLLGEKSVRKRSGRDAELLR